MDIGGFSVSLCLQVFISCFSEGTQACMALLKLSDAHSALRLEQACKRALSFTERPSLKSIQIILKSGQGNPPPTEPAPQLQELSGRAFTRGKAYYQQKEEC